MAPKLWEPVESPGEIPSIQAPQGVSDTARKPKPRSTDSYFPQFTQQIAQAQYSPLADLGGSPASLSPGGGQRSSGGLPAHKPSSGGSSVSWGSVDSSASLLLTAPASQPDDEAPPYKPKRKDLTSLSMHSNPDRKHRRRPKKHRTDSRHKSHSNPEVEKLGDENDTQREWWLPGRQVAPTAPLGFREPSWSLAQGPMDYGTNPLLPRDSFQVGTGAGTDVNLAAQPAPAVVTHRWSSVEVGAAEAAKKKTRPRSKTDTRDAEKSKEEKEESLQAIAEAVRNTLTNRPVRPEPPASITLRRASVAPKAEEETGRDLSKLQQGKSQQYLITLDDVDSIVNLIRSATSPLIRSPTSGGSRTELKDLPRKPSVMFKGILPGRGTPADRATTTITEVQTAYAGTGMWTPRATQTQSQAHRGSGLTRIATRKSVHEILWSNDDSPQESEERGLDGPADPRDPTSEVHKPGFQQVGSKTKEKTRAESLLRWTWRAKAPGESADVGADSSPSSSLDSLSPNKNVSRSMNDLLSATVGSDHDIASFPKLRSRAGTDDWISPLPSISEPSPHPFPLQARSTLYGSGLDMHRGGQPANTEGDPEGDPGATRPKPKKRVTWGRSLSDEVTQLLKSNDQGIITPRSKNQVSNRPHFVARMGEGVGTGIGSSSGRRKSSTPLTLQQRTVPAWLSKVKTWGPNNAGATENLAQRKAQLRSLSTDAGAGLSASQKLRETEQGRKPSLAMKKLEEVSRKHSIGNRTPPMVVEDHAGIYNSMTGARTGRRSCSEDCLVHDCEGAASGSGSASVDWIG